MTNPAGAGPGPGGKGKGQQPQQAQQPQQPPTTVWDRLNAAGSAKTPDERRKALEPVVKEVVEKGDINPLLQSLKDNRPSAQKAAVIALFYPEIKVLYWTNPEWRGIVAIAIKELFGASDSTVAMTAAGAVRELIDDGQVSVDALQKIGPAIKEARTKASGEVSLFLSYIIIKLHSWGFPCE